MTKLETKLKNGFTYIIAEIGMNHDGSLGNAIRLMEEAANAGVDAVKFQMHVSQAETLPNAPTPPYFKIEGRYEYFERTAFSQEEWKKLKKHSRKLKLDFIVSPFSIEAAEVLAKIGIDAYKIASGEVTNIPLLEYIKKTGIPSLLSSGMTNWQEINKAVKALSPNIKVLFQCSSLYPCPPEAVGLNIIGEMKKKYPKLAIGYSDHTLGRAAAIAVFMRGATVFEKHFTLSKAMYGADARFSQTPEELKEYVDSIRFVEVASKSDVDKDNLAPYKQMKYVFEKSIVAAHDLFAGHKIAKSDLAYKKPQDGIRADEHQKVVGRHLKKSKNKDDKIYYGDLK